MIMSIEAILKGGSSQARNRNAYDNRRSWQTWQEFPMPRCHCCQSLTAPTYSTPFRVFLIVQKRQLTCEMGRQDYIIAIGAIIKDSLWEHWDHEGVPHWLLRRSRCESLLNEIDFRTRAITPSKRTQYENHLCVIFSHHTGPLATGWNGQHPQLIDFFAECLSSACQGRLPVRPAIARERVTGPQMSQDRTHNHNGELGHRRAPRSFSAGFSASLRQRGP